MTAPGDSLPSHGLATLRGLVGKCPHCGQGSMFAGYLTIVERCSSCGEALGRYRAADGPAFFTISIVGLLLVPILGFGFVVFRPDPKTLLLVVAVLATVLTLVLLRLVKGVFVANLWFRKEQDPGA